MSAGPTAWPQCHDLEVQELCAGRYQTLNFGNSPPVLQDLGVWERRSGTDSTQHARIPKKCIIHSKAVISHSLWKQSFGSVGVRLGPR